MLKDKKTYIVTGAMALVGLLAGAASMAGAQVATTSAPNTVVTSSTSTSVDKPESPNDPADTDKGTETHGYRPLGGDGIIASINGSTIVVGEEADEGNASYTVDASKATISGKNGVAVALTDLKIGDKIFVAGSVSGTNVTATSISLGHPHEKNDTETNDDNGTAGN